MQVLILFMIVQCDLTLYKNIDYGLITSYFLDKRKESIFIFSLTNYIKTIFQSFYT